MGTETETCSVRNGSDLRDVMVWLRPVHGPSGATASAPPLDDAAVQESASDAAARQQFEAALLQRQAEREAEGKAKGDKGKG